MHSSSLHVLHQAARELSSPSSVARQGQGVAGTAVQWGAWGGQGMAVRTPGFMERMARMGLGIVQPLQGVAVLARLLQAAWAPLGRPLAQHALHVGEPDQGCALWGPVPGLGCVGGGGRGWAATVRDRACGCPWGVAASLGGLLA